jgi:hypothetical protein
MICNCVCMRIMHRFLDDIYMFMIGYGTYWVVKGRVQ